MRSAGQLLIGWVFNFPKHAGYTKTCVENPRRSAVSEIQASPSGTYKNTAFVK